MTSTQLAPRTTSPAMAMKNRNLQLYFGGQTVSMIGTWMQQMALSWLTYKLTNSAVMLGVIGFATQAPSFLFMPFAGIIADNTNRHRLVIITQTCALIQAAVLALVVWHGHVQIWHLALLGAWLGVINAFDMPTRQTFLVDMLNNKDELQAAIAINSSITTLTRLIGPALAGFVIASAGEFMCFLLNAVSYIAVVVSLLFVRPQARPMPASPQPMLAQLKEGFSYTFNNAPIRALILLLAFISLSAMPYAVLMPQFARDVYHGNASTLGLLTTASGVGSLIGAVWLASRKSVLGLGKWILIAVTTFGCALLAFSWSSNLLLSLVFLACVGFGMMTAMAASNTLLQTIVEEDKRGRVSSMFTMSFMGMAPFGSLIGGAAAEKIGPQTTIMISGALCLFVAGVFASQLQKLRAEVRPLYIERGIISAEDEMKVLNS